MMRLNIIGLSILFLSSLAFAGEEETKEENSTWNDYKIIADRNIFNRYRTGVVAIPRQQQVVTASEQSYYTLRGIARQADGYISFIEDARTGNVTRFKKGDAVAEGRISAIAMDDITYEYGDKTLEIEIGMNLEGSVLNSGMRYYSSGNGSSQAGDSFAEMGQMPGLGQTQGGMGQMPGMGQIPGMDRSQGGMGQMPGMDQSQTGDQFQGRGAQGRGMGQFQSSDQTTSTGQFQQNGQQQGTDQRQVMGQARSTGQSATTLQAQTTGQSSMAGQTGQTAIQSVTGA
ncbi:MAG: hypothetical protein JW944_16425, partial [Deltaproteobacteria bacterium]|nr:hypothetical protein [Deltaproteobacteria bacterium]